MPYATDHKATAEAGGVLVESGGHCDLWRLGAAGGG